MQAETDETPAPPPPRILFRVVPQDPDPGAIVKLEAELENMAPDRRAGRSVSFRNAAGEEMTSANFTEDSGCLKLGIDWIEVAAPSEPGNHVWTAVLIDPTREVVEDEEAAEGHEAPDGITADFTLSIQAHKPSLSVWDIPPAIERGNAFTLRVGIKCPHGCPSQGWAFTVHSHDGRELATGAVGDEAWPGTQGLNHAEVALTAPDQIGDFDWTVTANGAEEPCIHAPRSTTFKVHAVPQPDFVLRVEVVDAVTKAPVEKARVVVHPYRTVTNAEGVAELRLPAGDHILFVAGKQYFAFKSEGKLTENSTIRAEMVEDRKFSDADAWA